MPYLKHGNVQAYLKEHPDANRLQIVCTLNATDNQLILNSYV
jgi:hypothetical protein